MINLLQGMAGKLTDRWLSAITLPGLGFLLALAAAHLLGHARWADLGLLLARLVFVWSGDAPMAAVRIAAGLLAAAGFGAIAGVLAKGLLPVWLGAGPPWPSGMARARTERRSKRWAAADQATEKAVGPDLVRAVARRNRQALAAPERPTWMGTQIAAVATRTRNAYGLEPEAAWPRLLLSLPAEVRVLLTAAYARLDGAARCQAWGLMLLPVGAWWWPALGVGAALAVIGWARGRTATRALADLAEATIDLYVADLVDRMTKEIDRGQARVAGERMGKFAY
ncbi:hypothetical protein ABT158_22565 [Nonomuraea sp. NPDC001636]|uniref:hypothetical protein n=1 Tax=Nonomuraea sp. NPDC001636 TaxID=3154391 RepID=UPI00332D3DC7